MDYKKIDKVRKLLKSLKYRPDDVSPNLVASIAYNNNIELTSQEVVYISDNY